jgi:hypothetical protein
MFHFTKKKAAALATAAAVALTTGVAFAYFTSTGSGTGSATVGASAGVNLSSDAVSGLFPGGVDVPVTVHVANPGNGNEYVGTISGAVADNGDCLGSWFDVDAITYNTNVTHNASGPDAGTNVRMLDSGTNQDACQGDTLTINWSSN